MRTRLWIIGLCLTATAWLAGCAPGLDASEKQTAIIALQEGDYATAGVHADRYLRQNPDDVDALLLSSLCLARTASDMGGVNKAAYNLERATNLAPKRFDAWYLYGWLLYENGKYTEALTALPDFAQRVWLRILPSQKGLAQCLAAGFPPKHIICMQGPFSRELNEAMFRSTGAEILLTKESAPQAASAKSWRRPAAAG